MRSRPRPAPWTRARRILGINARNLLYVHRLNPRRHFPLADDKVRTKSALQAAGVPVPETLAIFSNLLEVSAAQAALREAEEFVIKPASGRQGGGIVIVAGHDGTHFRRAGGAALPWEDLRRAMGDILFGVHSVGQADRVLVERRIRPHAGLGYLAAMGLPDIRVILLHGIPVMSMMRIPTAASSGRANLHQGALGVAIRLADGEAFRAVLRRRPIDRHPDNGAPLTGFKVPLWDEILDVARRAARALPLPYLGADVVLAADAGPLIMEVNVRPGLEIQNVNGRGLRRPLQRIAGRLHGLVR